MKLYWKRAGCASIAEWRGFTFICEWIGKNMSCNVIIRGVDGTACASRAQEDIASAEAYCEDWIERNDHPEWRDVTDWLSWAEWHGVQLIVRPWGNGCRDGSWKYQSIGLSNDCDYGRGGNSRDDAKAAAEKWVREQGGSE